MSALKPAVPSTSPPPETARLFEARVAMTMDATECLLGDGRRATRAASCLALLAAGDAVLAAETSHGCHVLHILARDANGAPLTLAAPDDGELRLRGSRLRLHALEEAEIVAGGDLRFTSAAGNVALDARNLFMNVGESLVQQSRHFIGKALQYMVDARHLLKLHGKDALLTAERDIKADAERISMG